MLCYILSSNLVQQPIFSFILSNKSIKLLLDNSMNQITHFICTLYNIIEKVLMNICLNVTKHLLRANKYLLIKKLVLKLMILITT